MTAFIVKVIVVVVIGSDDGVVVSIDIVYIS